MPISIFVMRIFSEDYNVVFLLYVFHMIRPFIAHSTCEFPFNLTTSLCVTERLTRDNLNCECSQSHALSMLIMNLDLIYFQKCFRPLLRYMFVYCGLISTCTQGSADTGTLLVCKLVHSYSWLHVEMIRCSDIVVYYLPFHWIYRKLDHFRYNPNRDIYVIHGLRPRLISLTTIYFAVLYTCVGGFGL